MAVKEFYNVKIHMAWTQSTGVLPEAIVSNENLSETLSKIDNWYDLSGGFASEGVKPSNNGSKNVWHHFATCNTAVGTAAKTVTLDGAANNFVLDVGARIVVKFANGNTAGSPTLNVNGTGAKAIYYHGSALAISIPAGGTYTFVYNGTQWELVGDMDTSGGISARYGLKVEDVSGTSYIEHDVTTQTDSTSTVSALSFPVVDSITRDTWGHVLKINTKTVTTTDENVKQTSLSSGTRPLLAANTNNGTTETAGVYKITTATVASDGTVTATKFVGPVDLNNGQLTNGTIDSDTVKMDASPASASDDKTIATTEWVRDLIGSEIGPVVYKGTVGDSTATITWASLPAASAANKGFEYYVQANGTSSTAGVSGKVGDMIISNGTTWQNIPSGDEIIPGASDGIVLDDTTDPSHPVYKHTNSVTAKTTQGLYPIAYDAQGHITASGSAVTALKNPAGLTLIYNDWTAWTYDGSTAKSLTIKAGSNVTITGNTLGEITIASSHPTIATSTDTTSTASPEFGQTFTAVDSVTRDTNGHVTSINTKTVTLPTPDVPSPAKLGFGYAACTTATATVAKTASITDYVLTAGGTVVIKFTNDSGASPTLNISSKGAKPIYWEGGAVPANLIQAGDVVTMVYETSSVASGVYRITSIDHPLSELDELELWCVND